MDNELIIVLAFLALLALVSLIPTIIRLRTTWHRGSFYKNHSKRR